MKGNRQFNNLFLSNASTFNSSNPSRFYPFIKQSQYACGTNNFKSQTSVYSAQNSYYDKNLSTQQSTQRNSLLGESQVIGKHSILLQRSRSQIIQPVYFSPIKNDIRQVLDQSKDLDTSKASQVTFSKPSEFIINSQKQSAYLDNSKKSFISPSKIYNNDYGYICNNIYINNRVMKNSFMKVSSPIKQSYFVSNINPSKSSIVIKQINNQFNNCIDSTMAQSSIFNSKPLPAQSIIKNQIVGSNYGIRPQLRRALSTISIMSSKSKSQLSGTKINFNYISPPKSQNKVGRKLSFKKQEINNPLFKLNKKKQGLKTKIQPIPRQKINSEAINEYFPEFKIKRNKMKADPSPKTKNILLNTKKQKTDKSQLSQDDERRNTFIASLDAFSQISQIKQKDKEQSTEFSTTGTPKKQQNFLIICKDNQTKHKNSTNQITFNKIQGYRITFEGQKVQLGGITKQISQLKDQQVSKDSRLSVNSIKNVEDLDFSKKHGNDSSHTTDYQDEIVRKIKSDLGLNFSYYKK